MCFDAKIEDTGLSDNRLWGALSATATAATTTIVTPTPAQRALPQHKRGQRRKRSTDLITTVVGSYDEAHSAIKLCQPETSHGADFVSFAEGVFCDMETKTAWPLCEKKGVKDGCYDWATHALVETGGKRTGRGYSDVQRWE